MTGGIRHLCLLCGCCRVQGTVEYLAEAGRQSPSEDCFINRVAIKATQMLDSKPWRLIVYYAKPKTSIEGFEEVP